MVWLAQNVNAALIWFHARKLNSDDMLAAFKIKHRQVLRNIADKGAIDINACRHGINALRRGDINLQIAHRIFGNCQAGGDTAAKDGCGEQEGGK